MKNLKKIAALVIVLALALSSVSFAAFTDVKEDASYNEAVTVMAALDLLKGYEDGSFGPDKTITRAEFAAVVVRMFGMEDAAAGAAAATNFTDVPATHWAAGYVKIANQKEIILGYGDGTFGPDDEVTYEQAVKMLVCALGYAPMFADVADAYPTAYMAQANTLGMTVGATGKIGDKATRAIVARLAYNALDDKLMEQTGYGTEKKFEQVNKTLLSTYLKVAKIDATVNPQSFAKEDAEKVNIVSLGTVGTEYAGTTFTTGTTDAVAGLEIPKGYAVTAFIDYNEDEHKVLAVVPKAGKNEVLELTAAQLEEGTLTWAASSTADSVLGYYKTSAKVNSKTEEIKLAADLVVYKNENVSADSATVASGVNTYPTLAGNMVAGTVPTVKLINNDNDAAYDVLIYTEVKSDIVNDIYTVSESLSTKVNGYSFKFDKELDNQTYTLKDTTGKELSFADIKKGDIINVIESTDGTNKFFEYIISTDKVEGAVSEVDGSYVYINGKEYKNAAGVSAGDKGVFFVDILGTIIAKELDVSSRTFGLLYTIYNETEGADNEIKATIYTKDGKFENFTFAKNVEFTTAGAYSNNVLTSIPKEDLVYDATNKVLYVDADDGSDYDAATELVLNNANGQLIMYSANSTGAINQIVDATNINAASSLDFDYVSSASYQFDGDDNSINNNNVVDSTVIVANKHASALQNVGVKDNYSISGKAIFADDENYTIEYIFDTETDEIALAVVYNAKAKVEPTSPVMYVTADRSTAKDEDGDTYYIIKGLVNGELKSINVNSDTWVYSAEEAGSPAVPTPIAGAAYANQIKKGALIQYNEGEMASAVRVVLTDAQVLAIANGTLDTFGADYKDDDFGYLTSGKVVKYSNGMVYFDASAANANEKLKVQAGLPAAKITCTGTAGSFTAINKVFAAESVAEAKTEANAGTYDHDANAGTPEIAANDEVVIVYNFDGQNLACVIIDLGIIAD